MKYGSNNKIHNTQYEKNNLTKLNYISSIQLAAIRVIVLRSPHDVSVHVQQVDPRHVTAVAIGVFNNSRECVRRSVGRLDHARRPNVNTLTRRVASRRRRKLAFHSASEAPPLSLIHI